MSVQFAAGNVFVVRSVVRRSPPFRFYYKGFYTQGQGKQKMDRKSVKKGLLFVFAELIWGALLALFLQHTRPGRYIARNNKSWIAVVIGVAGTQIIGLLVLPLRAVCLNALAFSFSSIGVIARSLYNEAMLERRLKDAAH